MRNASVPTVGFYSTEWDIEPIRSLGKLLPQVRLQLFEHRRLSRCGPQSGSRLTHLTSEEPTLPIHSFALAQPQKLNRTGTLSQGKDSKGSNNCFSNLC